jgi:hypothetical protein
MCVLFCISASDSISEIYCVAVCSYLSGGSKYESAPPPATLPVPLSVPRPRPWRLRPRRAPDEGGHQHTLRDAIRHNQVELGRAAHLIPYSIGSRRIPPDPPRHDSGRPGSGEKRRDPAGSGPIGSAPRPRRRRCAQSTAASDPTHIRSDPAGSRRIPPDPPRHYSGRPGSGEKRRDPAGSGPIGSAPRPRRRRCAQSTAASDPTHIRSDPGALSPKSGVGVSRKNSWRGSSASPLSVEVP